MQDENTRYICIGPVNKAINMLCCWFEDPESEAFKRYIPPPIPPPSLLHTTLCTHKHSDLSVSLATTCKFDGVAFTILG